jgi:hypothetical protein
MVTAMKKYKVKPGDLLHTDASDGTIGIVYRETPKRFWYYAFGKNGLGGPFEVKKDYLYEKIDEGECFHQLGKAKYRRER